MVRASVRARAMTMAALTEEIFWHQSLVRKKLHFFGGALGSGIQDIKLVAEIVFGIRNLIPAANRRTWSPYRVDGWY